MEIFEGKTGSELDGDMEDLKEEAQERYEKQKPPGYEDYNGEEDLSRGECEDFLIWQQLMEFAERDGEDVVFITGDEKYDWWEKDDDHKIIRPRHELLREFKKRTGQTFWMFSMEHLIESASERMGLNVKDKSVEQTGKTAERASSEDFYEKFYGDKASRAFKLRNVSEELIGAAKILFDIESYIHAEGSEHALQKIYQAENKIVDRLSVALEVSDELETSEVERKAMEHLKKLSAAAQGGNDELAMSYAADLEDHLATVADTLREEANELAHSFTSSVAY
jgi:hypothetical protein